MALKIVRSTGNVFRDLGFSPRESEVLRIRAQLMMALGAVIAERQLTQTRAATLFGVSQPRVSDLVRGKIDRFSIDMLVEMLGRAGVTVDLVLAPGGNRARRLAPLHPPSPRRRRSRKARS